ncbi:MAG: hypothetical protein FWD38_05585 [Oscillospiraceae bacterium]|nr:hypothetical protein [Oscillospiraceae bacterium]
MKIFIEINTPGNGKSYELLLDDKLTVGAAKEMIIEQITAFENNHIIFDEEAALFSTAERIKLQDHRNLRKAGVESGNVLLLL